MTARTLQELDRDLDKARTRSVDNLQRLYTVVVSLAVTESLRRLLTPLVTPNMEPPGYDSWMMFVSFLVTVVPFYHGANRYLDATYVTGERRATTHALMIDFIALFLEGLLLFGCAMLVGNAKGFYTLLGCIFVFDAIWVGFTRLTVLVEDGERPSYKIWAGVNLAAAAALFVSFWSNILRWDFWSSALAANLAALGIAIGRTVYDYVSVWSFYYPDDAKSGAGLIPAPLPAPPPQRTPAISNDAR
jgi:hypothetical protein